MTERALRRAELLVIATLIVACIVVYFALPWSQRGWVSVALGGAAVLQKLIFVLLRRRARRQGGGREVERPAEG